MTISLMIGPYLANVGNTLLASIQNYTIYYFIADKRVWGLELGLEVILIRRECNIFVVHYHSTWLNKFETERRIHTAIVYSDGRVSCSLRVPYSITSPSQRTHEHRYFMYNSSRYAYEWKCGIHKMNI